ncbi:hypothetical protein GCM10020331_058810 [Ectobacillus funiculus]
MKSINTDIQVPIAAVKTGADNRGYTKIWGVKEIIAEYRTPTSGRNSNQLFNESRAAAALSNTLVAPNEVFSFNGRVGVTDAANGYKLAAACVNGKSATKCRRWRLPSEHYIIWCCLTCRPFY